MTTKTPTRSGQHAERTRTGPALKVAVGLFFFALSITAFICAAHSGDPDGKVMCGDDEMAPGDTCTTWVNGSSETLSYGEQADQNDSLFDPVFYVIGGLVGIALGIGALVDAGSTRLDGTSRTAYAGQAADRRPDTDTRLASSAAPKQSYPPLTSPMGRGRSGAFPEHPQLVVDGTGVEVAIYESGIRVRNGSRILDEFPSRRAEYRWAWDEIEQLELTAGPDGVQTLRCVVDGYRRIRHPIADTTAFTIDELQAMALVIAYCSGGSVSLQ
jgi:hypothetical protein